MGEGASYWLRIVNELKNRGVEDILIACVDGLQGFETAIKTVFPEVEIQECIIHQIRNSIRYVLSKHQKSFISDLKLIYKAESEEIAKSNLSRLEQKWGITYPIAVNSWLNKWEVLSTFLKYPEAVRKIIYTTNAVESLHRQFRKITKSRSLFPNDDALLKLLFLTQRNIVKKWTTRVPNWALVLSQFSIIFEDRLKKFL